MIGKTLQHYTVLDKIGEGGMGVVYLAHDGKLDRNVALKILPADLAAEDERLRRFQREARAIASLNHPNIVTIFAVEEIDGVHFLAMELIEGESLQQIIPSTGLILEDFFLYAIPIVEALAAAHEQGITHRDIKPSNVMVTPAGRVKVLDFGLAKLESGFGGNIEASTQTLTEEGSIIGTVPYMAPEQFTGKSLDARTDIFSVGILFHQMLTGSRPFTGESSAELISSILRDRPPPVSEIKTNLPNHLGRIVKRCLEKDPERRYQTAIGLRNELENLREEVDSGVMQLPASALPPDARAHSPVRARRSKPLFAAIGTVALLLAISLVVVTLGGGVGEETEPPTEDGLATTVAVLPLRQLGSESTSSFAQALTEEVSNRLTRLPGLQVVSQSTVEQSAAGGATAKQIGELVGADYILEGSLFWSEVEEEVRVLRLTERLIRVEDDIQVLSHDQLREFTDPFRLQSELAVEVAQLIGEELLELPPLELAALFPEPTPEPEDAAAKVNGASADPPRRPKRRAPPKPVPQRAPVREESPSTVDELTSAPAQAAAQQDTQPVPTEPETISLAVTLDTPLEQGVLTVYADDQTVFRRPFKPKRRRGSAGENSRIALPRSTTELRIYAAPAGQPAKLGRLSVDLVKTDATTLKIRVTRRGEVRAQLQR